MMLIDIGVHIVVLLQLFDLCRLLVICVGSCYPLPTADSPLG